MSPLKQLAFVTGAVLASFISSTTASRLPLQTTRDGGIISGRYIVALKSGLTTADLATHISKVSLIHANSALGRRRDIYSGVSSEFIISDWMGYSGHFDESTVAEIQGSPVVAHVEPDQPLYMQKLVTQTDSTWGLDSISHNDRKTPRQRRAHTYIHNPTAGEGMWAYVVDSGVRVTHEDFQGRAILGENIFPDMPHRDDIGHGTHVAGTIASKHYGVCKQCNLVSVKIFAEGKPSSMVTAIQGIAWAVKNITGEERENRAVINLSIGGAKSQALNDAIGAALKQGILIVVAAGNDGQDASKFSPSSAPGALVVGSVDKNHVRADYSNFGNDVDIFAPGVDIESLSYTADDAYYSVLSGTSMAAPHVTGLILYMKSTFAGTQRAPEAISKLKELRRVGVVKNTHGSPNFLAYNGASTNVSNEAVAAGV